MLLTAFGLPAQTLPSASVRATRIAPQPNPATTVQERVFPKIVSGDGWETAIVLLNMGPGTVKFRQFFLDAEGAPVTVTVRPQPDADVLTTAAVEGSLAPNSTVSLNVFATAGPCRESWCRC